MKKILFLLVLLLIPFNVLAIELPDTNSNKVLIYDLTDDKILHAKKNDEVSSIASLTKLMTVLVGIESIDNLDEQVTLTSSMLAGVPWDASIAYLQVGTTVTYRDLLYAIMLPSGADAAYAIARNIAGSLDEYVKLMNNKAKSLGMNNTTYQNVTGLDVKGHKSTIDDTLTLLKYALENETFKSIYTKKEYTMLNGQKLISTVKGAEEIINRDTSRIIGSKTGFTDDAGTCISAYFISNEHEMLLITLEAPPIPKYFYHVNDALDLISFVDNNYNNQNLIEKDTVVETIKVELSDIEEYTIKTQSEIKKYLPNDYNKELVKVSYKGEKAIDYNYKKGTKLGILSYYYDNELLKEEDVILEQDIKIDILKVLDKYKYIIVSLIVIIILLILIIKPKKKSK